MSTPGQHGDCDATIIDLDEDLRIATQELDQVRRERDALSDYIEQCRRRLIEAMQHNDPGTPMWAVLRDVTKRLAADHMPGEPVRAYPWGAGEQECNT